MNVIAVSSNEFLVIQNKKLILYKYPNELSEILYEFEEDISINFELIEIIDSRYITLTYDTTYVFDLITKEIKKIKNPSVGSKEISLDLCTIYDVFTETINEIFIPSADLILTNLSENFQYTKVNDVYYGFCKVFESYFLIELKNMNGVYFLHRITNHCGPTDVELFTNKKYIHYYNNEPIIKNSDRIFLFHRGETIYTQNNFLLTGINNMEIYNSYIYQKNNKYTIRNDVNILSVTDEYVVILNTNNSNNNNISIIKHSDCFQSQFTTTDESARVFLIILKDNNYTLIDLVNKIKTRTCSIYFIEISKNKIVVSTKIRMDSFMSNLKNIMGTYNFYLYEHYICIQFDNILNAESFGRFLC